MRRWWILFLFVICVGCQPQWTFAVLGDASIGQNGETDPTVLARAVEAINRTDAELVLFSGDLVYGRTVDGEETRRQYAKAKDILRGLRARLLIVPGNHDVDGARGQEFWNLRFARVPWTHEHRGWTFIGLNTEEKPPRRIQFDRQKDWLTQQLMRSKTPEHMVVLMHQPVWPHLAPGNRYHSTPRPDLHDLFKEYKVVGVFSGHEHTFQQEQRDGVLYVTSGGAGAELLPGSQYHFLLVHVRGRRLEVEKIDLSATKQR